MKQLFILIAACLCSAVVMAQEPSAIQRAMSGYDYENAILMIDREPPTQQLLMLKAQALKGLFRYSEAVDVLQKADKEDPGNIRLLLELSECNKLAGNLKQALECYEQALALNPENSYTKLQQLNLLYLTERYPETIAECLATLGKDSTAIVLRLLAQSYHNTRQPDSAMVYYAKAIEKNPDDYVSAASLSSIYITNEKYEEAIKLTEDFRRRNEDNLYINRHNAQAYCLNQNHDKAIERYESLAESGDTSQLTCFYLGMSYFATEKPYEAEKYLRLAHEQAPDNVNILYYLGLTWAKTSWKKEAVEMLQQAIDITTPTDENMARLYAGLAECHMYNKDPAGRIAALKEQYKYRSQNNILYRIGSLYQDALKDNENAKKYLEIFLKNKPENGAEAGAEMQEYTPQPQTGKGFVVKTEGASEMRERKSIYEIAEDRLQVIKEDNFWKGKGAEGTRK